MLSLMSKQFDEYTRVSWRMCEMTNEILRKAFDSRIINRAKKDEAFRKLLLENPKQAIQVEFNEAIPDSIKIFVHEETEDTYHFVISWNPFMFEEGISDQQLEIISGGTFDYTDVVISTTMCTTNLHN